MHNAAQSPLRSINYGSRWRDVMTLRPVDEPVIISRTIKPVMHACTKRLHIHTSVFFSCPYFLILPFTHTHTLPLLFFTPTIAFLILAVIAFSMKVKVPSPGPCKFKSACDKHAWNTNFAEQTTRGFINLVFCPQND